LDKPLITVLLVLHDLTATALLGLITVQVALMGRAGGETRPSFLTRNRPLDVAGLSPAIIALFVIVVGLGACLYPSYRMMVRPYLELHDLRAANGAFEVKEHFAALALLMQPLYWSAWRRPLAPALSGMRRIVTFLLAGMVWWNFLAGHLINYVTGPFQ
jgi:hypothetical protein